VQNSLYVKIMKATFLLSILWRLTYTCLIEK